MPQIMLECKNCSKIFPSGFSMTPGASATFIGNRSRCPYCQSWENIPDGTFMATVNSFVDLLKDSKNPLKDAKEILRGIEQDNLTDVSQRDKVESFLKRNKLKIGITIAVLKVIINMITRNPNVRIDEINVNQEFYTQYNQYIDSNQ